MAADGPAHAASQCAVPRILAWVTVCAFAAAAISLRAFAAVVLRLLGILSPGRPPAVVHISWAKVWLGVLVEQALIPAALLTMWLTSEIEWGGIRYRKWRGRVRVIPTR
jgi:hypothetical protein